MKFKVSFGEGYDIDTLHNLLSGLFTYNLRLTIGGKPQDARLESVEVDERGNYVLRTTFFAEQESGDITYEDKTRDIPLENIWEIHIY